MIMKPHLLSLTKSLILVSTLALAITEAACEVQAESDSVDLTPTQAAAAEQAQLTPEQVASLVDKPLYEFSEQEVDIYLKYLQALEPDLRRRVVHLARKNIGQPYELYLLGEMPFEPYDPQPIYCLDRSDCVVFSEHTYAMALGHDWPSFMSLLQRIRYRDGKIGVATRNHYTEADWNPSNRWLVRDITKEAGGDGLVRFQQRVDRSGFLKRRYSLEVEIPVEQHEDVYLPIEKIDLAKPHLREGDFVNIVRGRLNRGTGNELPVQTNAWVGHVGLIVHGDDDQGSPQINLIHSAQPKVREEPIDEYISHSIKNLAELEAADKPRLLGFKFLRLESDPLANLQKLDGPDAPRVTLPTGGKAEFK